MFIHQLFEDSPRRVVVTYPGRFQPFHKGHRDVFANLQKRFGRDNVFIVTGNKTDAYKSPFNFSDKIKFMSAMGVPADRVIETDKVYDLPAIFQNQKEHVVFITVVGAPDAKRLNPGATKKDGSPSYFQVLPKDADQMITADKHGYVIVEPEHPEAITIGGKTYDVSHGTPTRELWNQVRNNPQQRNEFLQQLYGTTDPELGVTLDKIPTGAPDPAPQPSPKLAKIKPDAAPKKPQAKLNTVKLPKPEKIAPVKPKKVEKELGEDPQFVGQWKGTDSARVAKGKYVGEDAAGVGVVKNSKDPRYVMATTGNQNDIDSKTLGKMMRGYHLIGKNPANTKQTPVKGSIAESSVSTTVNERDKDWDEGNTEPPNNFAVHINGKQWRVFQGRGHFADDVRERQQYRQLQNWAQAKSASTGKKWTVHLTGAPATANEGKLNEFAPPGSGDGDDGFSDDTLKRLAAQWWQGDEDPRVERTLAAAGWEIGQDEGYDNGGVFVVQAGDVNGNSYISWPSEELEGLSETKSLHKRVKIVKGPDAGKYGWIREIKHSGPYKGAPKTYYVDIEGGGQSNNLPATALRIAKEQDVSEGGIATVGWPDEGNHTGNNPPVTIGGTFPARPVVKKGSLVKVIGLTGVHRVMDIRGDQAYVVQEIPNSGGSNYVPMSDLRVWTNKPVKEQAEELNIGDDVIITGNVEFKGATGVITDFGNMKRFVVVDLYNHGKHSFHSSDVGANDYADSDREEADMYDRDEDFRRHVAQRDMDEGMYQYDKQDPFNSEFAPAAGMGRMTLRGWKQSLIRRAKDLANELEQAGQHIDNAALWDRVYAKLKSTNMDPIAQEIELAHQELENIRKRGGVRSRAFKK
jgi:hypothetical protein